MTGRPNQPGFWQSPAVARYGVLIALLTAWELLARSEAVSPVILPSLSSTVLVATQDYKIFAAAFVTTAVEILAGLAIAYVLGGFIGLLVGSVASLRGSVLPLISSVYAIPFIVLYPVMTAWLGIGYSSKVLFGGMYGFFPMVLASAAGVRLVDPRLVLAARSMGGTRLQIISEIMIPAALPSIIAGLRIGGAMVSIGVVVAEMLASTDGIGFLITQYRTMFKTPDVYLGIVLVLVLAGVVDVSIGAIERMLSRKYHWKRV
jgi:NitT/TauT family transport system permease protein/taurine transport system permease protein